MCLTYILSMVRPSVSTNFARGVRVHVTNRFTAEARARDFPATRDTLKVISNDMDYGL